MANIGDQLLQPETGWQRIDSSNINIKYENMAIYIYPQYNFYNTTLLAKNDVVKECYFEFYVYTSKLRLYDQLYSNRDPNSKIYIDNDIIGEPCSGYSTTDYDNGQRLYYEKINLDKKIHKIIVKSNTNNTALGLDCLDIDEDGYMVRPPANVGDQLLQPESGWKRIDDKNELINYYGEWLYQEETEKSNGGGTIINPSASLEQIQSAYAEFYFFGSKIRIISEYYEQSSMKYTMEIDGEKIVTSAKGVLKFQCIISEKLNLDKKPHKVKIYSGDDKRISIDAIDIDEDGYMLAPPASVGDQLLQPDSGWKRYNETDALILKEPTATGQYSGVIKDKSCYEGTAYQLLGGTIRFYANSKKIRIIGFRSPVSSYTNNAEIYVDGIKIGSFSNVGNSIVYQCLLYDGELGNGTHEVVISNNTGLYLNLDAIDIDEDGYLLTEDEFKKSNKFPVLIGDDTITSEENIAHYCATLTNGERQLLVSDKLKGIYLTDGQGGYTKINTGGDGSSIDDENIAEDKVFSNQKTQELIEDVIDKTLDKETYASETNEGAVKYADNLSITMNAQPLQYYGTNNENELGMHYFPINTKDNTGLEQRVCLDVKANQIITVDSALDISDNKVIVDCYKFVSGEENVISTIKTFNNTEKDNFFYDEDNIEFTDSMHIKKEYELVLNKNNEGFYESEMIDMNKFLELSLSEVIE